MKTLKYIIIASDSQYDKYSKALESLIFSNVKTKAVKDEIDLLTLLIEKYDAENNIFYQLDPIDLLKSLMKERKMKNVELAKLLDVSEGLISDIIKKKKGLSKETIRILAKEFKLKQEAFNRVYPLQLNTYPKVQNARLFAKQHEMTSSLNEEQETYLIRKNKSKSKVAKSK